LQNALHFGLWHGTKTANCARFPIPVHYLYIFVVGAAVGFVSLTGIASSYARMLFKVSATTLRTEKEDLKTATLAWSSCQGARRSGGVAGSLASEVSSLYGLEIGPHARDRAEEQVRNSEVSSSLDQLYA